MAVRHQALLVHQLALAFTHHALSAGIQLLEGADIVAATQLAKLGRQPGLVQRMLRGILQLQVEMTRRDGGSTRFVWLACVWHGLLSAWLYQPVRSLASTPDGFDRVNFAALLLDWWHSTGLSYRSDLLAAMSSKVVAAVCACKRRQRPKAFSNGTLVRICRILPFEKSKTRQTSAVRLAQATWTFGRRGVSKVFRTCVHFMHLPTPRAESRPGKPDRRRSRLMAS